MKYKRALFTVIALSLLAGCGWLSEPEPELPANLTRLCPDLPRMTGNTMGDLLAHDVQVMGLYRECAARHAGLARAVTP